jgi:hypothetical protein
MGSVNCCNKPTEIQDLEPKDTTKEINQTDKDLEPQDNSKIEPIDNQRGSGSIHEIYSGDGDKEVQIDIPNDKESEPQKNDDNKESQNEGKKDEEPQNEQEQNEQAENEQEQNEQERNEQEQNELEQNQPEEKQPEEEQPEQVQQEQEAEQPEEKQPEKEQQEQEQPKEKDGQKEEKKEEEENVPHEKHVEENKNEDIEIKEVELKQEEPKNPEPNCLILQQNEDNEVKYTNKGEYTPAQNIIGNEFSNDNIYTNRPNEQIYQYGQKGNFASFNNNVNYNEKIGQIDYTSLPKDLPIENLQSCEPAPDAILDNFSNDEYKNFMNNITDKSYQTVYNVGEGSTYPAPLVNGGQNMDMNNTGKFNEFNLLNYNNYQYEKPQEFKGGYVQQFKSLYNAPKKITSNQNFNFGDLGFAEVKPSITSVSYMKPKGINFNLNYSFGNNVEFSEYNTSNNYFKNEVVDPMNSFVYNKSYIGQP